MDSQISKEVEFEVIPPRVFNDINTRTMSLENALKMYEFTNKELEEIEKHKQKVFEDFKIKTDGLKFIPPMFDKLYLDQV